MKTGLSLFIFAIMSSSAFAAAPAPLKCSISTGGSTAPEAVRVVSFTSMGNSSPAGNYYGQINSADLSMRGEVDYDANTDTYRIVFDSDSGSVIVSGLTTKADLGVFRVSYPLSANTSLSLVCGLK